MEDNGLHRNGAMGITESGRRRGVESGRFAAGLLFTRYPRTNSLDQIMQSQSEKSCLFSGDFWKFSKAVAVSVLNTALDENKYADL